VSNIVAPARVPTMRLHTPTHVYTWERARGAVEETGPTAAAPSRASSRLPTQMPRREKAAAGGPVGMANVLIGDSM
jgi:hypothetical protein